MADQGSGDTCWTEAGRERWPIREAAGCVALSSHKIDYERKAPNQSSDEETRQGREARAAVAVCDRVFSTDSAGHAGLAGIVYPGALRTIPDSEFKKYLARHEVALVSHRDGSNSSSPSYLNPRTLMVQRFTGFVSQEMPPLKDPGRLGCCYGHAIKRKVETRGSRDVRSPTC
jgi:hypothetical protein